MPTKMNVLLLKLAEYLFREQLITPDEKLKLIKLIQSGGRS